MISLIFSDECGSYQKQRTKQYIKSHPFYVRANVMISADEYIELEKRINKCKQTVGVKPHTEIKWSHFGNALKQNWKTKDYKLSARDLIKYYTNVLDELENSKSCEVFFTVTDNAQVNRIDEVKLIKMHLQNAYQRAHYYAKAKNTTAFVIADDLNDKTKIIKTAIYELTCEGDQFINYDNVNKGLFIDYSDQCTGLQIADICAGIFTANLKYTLSNAKEKKKYFAAHELFEKKLCSVIRYNPQELVVYSYGVTEVPNGAGRKIAKRVSEDVHNVILQKWFQD